jgi:integrase
MPTIDFTVEGLTKLAAAPGTRVEYRSRRHAGLALRVSGPTAKYPDGRKIFSTVYRFGAEQQRDTYHPPYSQLSLTEAIKRWKGTIAAVETGTNPAAVKRERRMAAKPREPDTVRRVVQRYVKDHLSTLSLTHYTNTKHYFDEYVLPRWGDRAIGTITRDDARDLIQEVLDTGKRVTANRLQATLTALFNWAVSELQCIAASPLTGLKRRHIEVARERHLGDAEIVIVWRGAERLEYPAGPYMRMLTALGQRREETAKMRLVNIDADWVWEIPREDTKPGRTHRVTLPPIARAIINDCRRAIADNVAQDCRETGRPLPAAMPDLDFVFAGRYGGHLSSYSLAKHRIDAAIEAY